jgi:hypothetical protein
MTVTIVPKDTIGPYLIGVASTSNAINALIPVQSVSLTVSFALLVTLGSYHLKASALCHARGTGPLHSVGVD